MLSTQSSITDGICRMLIRNNEGNRKTQQKQTNNSQHREAWVIDSFGEFRCWKTNLKPMFLVILRLRTNERLLRTRVFTTLYFIVSVKCVLKLILLVISRLRPFLKHDPKLKKKRTHKQSGQKNTALREHPLQTGSLIPCREGFIDQSTLQPFNSLTDRPSPINQNPHSHAKATFARNSLEMQKHVQSHKHGKCLITPRIQIEEAMVAILEFRLEV